MRSEFYSSWGFGGALSLPMGSRNREEIFEILGPPNDCKYHFWRLFAHFKNIFFSEIREFSDSLACLMNRNTCSFALVYLQSRFCTKKKENRGFYTTIYTGMNEISIYDLLRNLHRIHKRENKIKTAVKLVFKIKNWSKQTFDIVVHCNKTIFKM